MRFHSRLVGLLDILVAVPVLGGIPDSPQQVQLLSVGARAPMFAGRIEQELVHCRIRSHSTL
jgi:hypothetical protein